MRVDHLLAAGLTFASITSPLSSDGLTSGRWQDLHSFILELCSVKVGALRPCTSTSPTPAGTHFPFLRALKLCVVQNWSSVSHVCPGTEP